jgi:SAM-dependent methyltransferase
MKTDHRIEMEFYKRHYSGGLKTAHNATSHDNIPFIAPGSRYGLAVDYILLNASESSTIVDLGCGDARILFELNRQRTFSNLIGVDAAYEKKIEINEVKLFSHDLNSPWPFSEGSVNYIMAMMIFEHLFDPFFCFEEVKRILAPNGRAFVNLPLVTGLQNRFRLLMGRVPVTSRPTAQWLESREWDGGHLHYYSLEMISALAKACKLEVEMVNGVGRYHGIKTLLPSLFASEVTFSLRHA